MRTARPEAHLVDPSVGATHRQHGNSRGARHAATKTRSAEPPPPHEKHVTSLALPSNRSCGSTGVFAEEQAEAKPRITRAILIWKLPEKEVNRQRSHHSCRLRVRPGQVQIPRRDSFTRARAAWASYSTRAAEWLPAPTRVGRTHAAFGIQRHALWVRCAWPVAELKPLWQGSLCNRSGTVGSILGKLSSSRRNALPSCTAGRTALWISRCIFLDPGVLGYVRIRKYLFGIFCVTLTTVVVAVPRRFRVASAVMCSRRRWTKARDRKRK